MDEGIRTHMHVDTRVIQTTGSRLPRPELPHHMRANKHQTTHAYFDKGSYRQQAKACLAQDFHITARMDTRIRPHAHTSNKNHTDNKRRFASCKAFTSLHLRRCILIRTPTYITLQAHRCVHNAASLRVCISTRKPKVCLAHLAHLFAITIAPRCETRVHHATPLQRWGKPPFGEHVQICRPEANLLDRHQSCLDGQEASLLDPQGVLSRTLKHHLPSPPQPSSAGLGEVWLWRGAPCCTW